jgi:hypothetical protein
VRPATLYVREGCHLCEQFLLELALDLGEAVHDVAVTDVDRDTDLALRFGLRVPVFEVDGAVACEGAYDRPRVRQALRL